MPHTLALPNGTTLETGVALSAGDASAAVQAVARDPLFDAGYYLAHNPDVAASGLDPYQHYLAYGAHEGRNPDAFFDTSLYLRQNPDVERGNTINPLRHYELYGWREGRDPSLLFSTQKYLSANPDVRAAGIDPLQHYIEFGQKEGRMTFLSGGSAPADPLIDPAYFDPQLGATLIPSGLAAQQQAAATYLGGRYVGFGIKPDPLFDDAYYQANNLDTSLLNPLQHYERYGWHDGRDPSAAFSTTKYLAANADVKAAGIDPLLHYVEYGKAEGRAVYPGLPGHLAP